MQDVSHAHASAEGGRHHGSTHGTYRGFNTCVLKAPTDAPSEELERHNGVRTMDIEVKAIMVNVQHNSFFQEGADDSHWAALRQMGGPRWLTQSVLERDAGIN
jgi:hypothetical protein